ncbi:hypothetical protein FRC09_001475, partial [Ceratobasidium sp. 395]
LSEIAKGFKEGGYEEERLQCFKHLGTLPSSSYQKFRGDLIVEGACLLMAESVSLKALSLPLTKGAPDWRQIVINSGMKHQNEAVQAAATLALAAISELVDCAPEVLAFAREFQTKNASPAVQCSISKALGALAYEKFGNGLDEAIECLLGGITVNSETYSRRVEARRNCIASLADIVTRIMHASPGLLSSRMSRIYTTILSGLEDYAVDQRGDVGSWVRIASLRAIASTSEAIFARRSDLTHFEAYLPPGAWYDSIGGVLKQGAERLDNVRAVAGEQLMILVWNPTIRKSAVGSWAIPGLDKLESSFPQNQPVSWNDGEWLFPKMAPLLDIEAYRLTLLSGIITSLGSRNESSATSNPNTREQHWSLIALVDAVLDVGRANLSSNNVMIPVLKTLDVLFEGEVLALDQAGKGSGKLKNVQRIIGAMKVVVDFIALAPVAEIACRYTETFLGHHFPKVSADTAEALYLLTQTQDVGESEELEQLLLETPWISLDHEARKLKAKQVVTLLHAIAADA